MDAVTLRQILTLASAFKEGDLAVGGTTDERLRADARNVLLATAVGDIHNTQLIDDGVSAELQRARDRRLDSEISPLSIASVRAALLSPAAVQWVQTFSRGLASEVIAAVVKVMSNDELSSVARVLFHPLRPQDFTPHGTDGIALGSDRHFGSRIQPNSPGDDEQQILFSIFEGLSHGCGDVIIGLNPAADDLDTIIRLEQLLERVVSRLDLPTRFCVLSDLIKQHGARQHTRIDVGFQSLAGTSRALVGMVNLDVSGLSDLARAFSGLYFETGQGSEVTNGAADGVDMGTLEARTYGVARSIQRSAGKWTIVNDVAGFIGPEVFRTADQLERVCLEDVVMAKLHGLTMGLDVCSTFHMGISPSALRAQTLRVVERAAPAYLMAVAGNADPMLGYLTTSFREHEGLRRQAGRQMTSVMCRRLEALGVLAVGRPIAGPEMVGRLSAIYARAGGDRRSLTTLEGDGQRRLHELREQGLDLGISDAAQADARVETIYAHARAALYSTLDGVLLHEASTRPRLVRTVAKSRDQYLAAPPSGERLRDEDARAIEALYPERRPRVQMTISDGLNANAVNEHLRALLPGVRRALANAGHLVGETDIVVQNGRVRAGYEIGGRVGADVVVHLIGERPGTGLNTLSAYVTYGRDETGAFRWSRDLPHSATTAICGIHPKGKPPDLAIAEIASVVGRIVEERRSGVTLGAVR
ncbi:MAG TPA: ethanolamine ammonia-lyase subunit EutB [Vicinamibacterales bacterium]|nr:ethanolamine ammonia-lyase subunit EutB [Vicinamibacterales bacterium]